MARQPRYVRLHYERPNELARLHDELLAALPWLAGSDERVELLRDAEGQIRRRVTVTEPRLRVEGSGDDVWLTVSPDADRAAIARVVEAHAPTAAPAAAATTPAPARAPKRPAAKRAGAKRSGKGARAARPRKGR